MASEGQLQLSNEELKEFQEIFNLVDRDRSGSITKDELAKLMTTLSINASQQELDLMIDEIDANNDGMIQFEEFVAVMSRKVQATYTAVEVKRAFKMFEGNAPAGHIKIDALEHALRVYGSDRLTADQILDLVNDLDYDSNGYFNYDEYVTMMLQE